MTSYRYQTYRLHNCFCISGRCTCMNMYATCNKQLIPVFGLLTRDGTYERVCEAQRFCFFNFQNVVAPSSTVLHYRLSKKTHFTFL